MRKRYLPQHSGSVLAVRAVLTGLGLGHNSFLLSLSVWDSKWYLNDTSRPPLGMRIQWPSFFQLLLCITSPGAHFAGKGFSVLN